MKSLAERHPESPLIVTASPEYLDAIADDLTAAEQRLADPGLLTILCRRGSLPGLLEARKIYLSAELSSALGGTLLSMNVRVLLWLLQGGTREFHHAEIRRSIDELRAKSTPRIVPTRQKVSDTDIWSHINTCLKLNRNISGSAALKALRNQGLAAEQKRFQKLFAAVREETHHA